MLFSDATDLQHITYMNTKIFLLLVILFILLVTLFINQSLLSLSPPRLEGTRQRERVQKSEGESNKQAW